MSISDFIMGIEDYEDVQRWKKMAKCFRPGDAAALSLFFMNEICPDQEEGRNCDLCGREAKDLCDLISRVQAAAEMAEGKIGNGNHIAETDQMVQCWQITEERKAALDAMSSMSETMSCPACDAWIRFADIGPYMDVLRGMLAEVTR